MRPGSLDAVWVIFSAALVFFMQAGFLAREVGLTRSKNGVNAAVKIVGGVVVVAALYWAVGFGLATRAVVGLNPDGDGYFFGGATAAGTSAFLTSLALCAATAAIVSGATAERLRAAPYLVFVALLGAAVFPFCASWAAGSSGWLGARGFVDLGGTTWVHSLGGWMALAAVILVGPRAGRFDEAGHQRNAPFGSKAVRIPGSSLPLAAVGVFILWLGLIGAAGGAAPLAESLPRVAANLIIGGAAGGIVALAGGWAFRGKSGLDHTLNGVLVGLISVSGAAPAIALPAALIAGVVGGALLLILNNLLARARLDDAVGAIPVHLGGGVWGAIAVGLFADPALLATGLSHGEQLRVQLEGVLAAGTFGFASAFALLWLIGRVLPLRLRGADEDAGLDAVDHDAPSDMEALLDVMEEQAGTGDMSLRAGVEPFTEIGAIARQYNRVMETLEFTTAQTESLVRTSLDALLTFNPEGSITSSNPAASAIFGYGEREFRGVSVASLFAPVDQDRRRADLPALIKQLVGQTQEVRGLRRNGEQFPMEASFTYVSVGEDEIYTANIRDITQRKDTEADLNRAQAEIRRRLELELEDAKVVQRALLPTEDQFPGCEIARHFQAASETGGDWYGYTHHADSQSITLYMGDVTGHGLPSALMSGVVCGAVYAAEQTMTAALGKPALGHQARGDTDRQLRSLAEVVNRIVLQTGKGELLMTMAFLHVDLRSGQLVFLNAGHNMPYLVKPDAADGAAVTNLISRGSRLGESARPDFEVVRAKLEPGDVVVLYTDGLIENEGADGRVLTVRDVKSVLTSKRGATEIRDELLGRARAVWGDHPLRDDHSILVFRYLPATVAIRKPLP